MPSRIIVVFECDAAGCKRQTESTPPNAPDGWQLLTAVPDVEVALCPAHTVPAIEDARRRKTAKTRLSVVSNGRELERL